MTLRETLEKIKRDTKEENFNIMIESMKRRADKGMIPNVSSKDIENCLREMEEENSTPISILEKEEMIAMISDLDNACKKYSHLCEDEDITDEHFNILALDEFYKQMDSILKESLADRYAEFKDKREAWKEENPTEHGRYMAAAGAGAGVAAASPFLIDTARRHALRKQAIKQAYIDYNNKMLAAAEFAGQIKDPVRSKLVFNRLTPKEVNPSEIRAQFNAENPSLLRKAINAVSSGTSNTASWLAAHPYIGAGLIGAGTVAAGSLLALAIRRARRKRQAQLRENDNNIIIFDTNIIKEAKSFLDIMPDIFIEYAIINSNELVQELIFEACEYSETIQESALNEAVTYINNNGQLKTKNVEEYVKDMHKYDNENPIEKFDLKKRKNRKYSLLDENLDSFKKLSEMSLEEILAEAEENI